MDKRRLHIMVEIAMAVAIAMVLSQFRLFRMPQGGSVTLMAVPLLVIAYRWGGKAGFVAGLTLGILRLALDAYVIHWAQFILDYPLAFALLGSAGFMAHKRYLGATVGFALRFVCHFLVGATFFASFAPEGTPVALYSLIYNGSFLIPEWIVTLLVAPWLYRRLESALPARALGK
ncbi:MAG: energy-coupled thiamine transporter ThiT [Bacillota bacterium]